MTIIVTGTYKAISFSTAQTGAEIANINDAPASLTGAITSDNAIEFLRRIANAG